MLSNLRFFLVHFPDSRAAHFILNVLGLAAFYLLLDVLWRGHVDRRNLVGELLLALVVVTIWNVGEWLLMRLQDYVGGWLESLRGRAD